jgi:hypothetical protein
MREGGERGGGERGRERESIHATEIILAHCTYLSVIEIYVLGRLHCLFD